MNDEQHSAIVPHSESQITNDLEIAQPVVQKEDGNVAVTAFEPNDMPQCQEALKAWAVNKVRTLDSDVEELERAVAEAKQRKWKTSTFQRHLGIAKKRVEFYRKIMCALQAGYVIVPNFPVQAFAIRTKKEQPAAMWVEARYKADCKQVTDCLPVDEGEYKNPFPVVASQPLRDQQGNVTMYRQWAEEWDEMDFPISMAKGEIMQATGRAMTLKIFDELGILPKARKEDPIIVGLVHLRGPCGYTTKTVTFMIAWHLDTRVL